MNIFILLTIALAIILILLRKKIPIGISMLVSGVFLWLVQSRDVDIFPQAIIEVAQLPRTYDILIALYLVMCLEIELRQSGLLSDMVETLHGFFSDVKILLATMPAFLGLLPSIGGARFSAPIVEELSKDLNLSAEKKADINFWFRHVFEFSNPIIPGLILACSIAGVTFSEFLRHIAWMTIVALLVGYFVILRPIKIRAEVPKKFRSNRTELAIAFFPVVLTFILATVFGLNASIAIGISVTILYFILLAIKHAVPLKNILIDAIDLKMLGNIFAILFFVQLLTDIKILDEIVRISASPVADTDDHCGNFIHHRAFDRHESGTCCDCYADCCGYGRRKFGSRWCCDGVRSCWADVDTYAYVFHSDAGLFQGRLFQNAETADNV